MIWSVAAAFFRADRSNRWLDDLLPRPGRQFRKVSPRPSGDASDWHARSVRASPAGDWLRAREQAARALKTDGVITLFPPLALMVGLQNRILRRRKRHVAWCFNLGQRPAGLKGLATRFAMQHVDHVVVHSTAERKLVADYCGLPMDRVSYVPLQTTAFSFEPRPRDGGFILAMGSANRDYATLIKALEIARVPAKIVAAPRLLAGLSLPQHVEALSGLTRDEAHDLMRNATINVVPILDETIASGQVTIVDAMAVGGAVISTRSIGTVDYIDHGINGLLVDRGDFEALASAIRTLWDDRDLRLALGDAALAFAKAELSDPAAARHLDRILTSVEASE